MNIRELYNSLFKECVNDVPYSQYINYIVPEPKIWTTLSRIRIRPFYYCSKPSTKRWKR